MNEDKTDLYALFQEASRLEGAERDAFLSEVQARDRELAEKLQRLLERDAVSGTLPSSPTTGRRSDVELTEVSLADESVSAVLDQLSQHSPSSSRYAVGREIARGGMGRILEVRDTDLRRSLAMKVGLLESGQGGSPDAERRLSRFLEEAQISAQLDHPGIVPVHELAIGADGRPFFTMKLVRGRDLSQVFEEAKTGDTEWTQTRLLGVLLRVCEAMAYAHHKGVIHRDLKPSNVMVGRFGEVYVMDWGIARVLGRADPRDVRVQPPGQATEELDSVRKQDPRSPASPLLTMDGHVIGTPGYMSPEQAQARIDEIGPATDVYAVGAMLYHALAGRMPYAPERGIANNLAIWSRVQEGPPRGIRELAPDVSAELVAVCDKAMARSPSQRYEHMSALADDLRAYLEGRVVRAYESGARAEARKWLLRNKALAVSLAAGVVLLLSGLGAVGYVQAKGRQAEREQREIAQANAEKAEALADEAVRQAGLAQEQQRVAEEALAVSETVTSFLVSQFEALQPEETRGQPVMVSELLDRAAQSLEEEAEFNSLEANRLRDVVGRGYVSLGLLDRAEPLLTRVWRDRAEHLGTEHPDTLDVMRIVGDLYTEQGRLEEAEALLIQVSKATERVRGESHPDSLTSMNSLMTLYAEQGRYEDAEAVAIRAREMSRDGDHHLATLRILGNLGTLYLRQGRYEQAEAALLKALETARATHGDDHPSTLESQGNLGAAYLIMGRFEEAERLFTELLDASRAVLGETHPIALDTQFNLAQVQLHQGRLEEVEARLTELLDASAELNDEHPRMLMLMTGLAHLYADQARFDEAETMLLRVLEASRARLGEDHPDTLSALYVLSKVYWGQDRLDDAEALLARVSETRRAVLGEDHPDTLGCEISLAAIYLSQGRSTEAEALSSNALDRSRVVLGEQHPISIAALHNLALSYQKEGRLDDAESLYLGCLEKNREVYGEGHRATLAVVDNLARLYVQHERWLEALPLARTLLDHTPIGSEDYEERQELLDRISNEAAEN